MEEITTEAELRQLHEEAAGFIYNDYAPQGVVGNVLHFAGCPTLSRAKVSSHKYFAGNLYQAERWLAANRQERWRYCDACTA